MITRRAVSLVELLVVMSACTLILTMSAQLLHRAMRTQTQTRAFFDVERSALRLARYFRQDVHLATTALVGDVDLGENVKLRLLLPDDRTVEYSHLDGYVRRILSHSGGRVAREEFLFHASVELAIRQEDSPPRLMLTVTSDPHDTPAARALPVSLHVEAGLHRDSRISDVSADQEEPQ